jgi:hypothetical protein
VGHLLQLGESERHPRPLKSLLCLDNPDHLGAADRAHPLHSRPPILQRYPLLTPHLPLRSALHTVGLHLDTPLGKIAAILQQATGARPEWQPSADLMPKASFNRSTCCCYTISPIVKPLVAMYMTNAHRCPFELLSRRALACYHVRSKLSNNPCNEGGEP